MADHKVEPGQLAFIGEGPEKVGGIRLVNADEITIYVENAGDFKIPRSAVKAVHDGKVILEASALSRPFLSAVGHQHDREDPALAG